MLEKIADSSQEEKFKQTEIGLIPEDWEVVGFEDAILRKRIKIGKVKQQEYKKVGKYPVIDQSQNFIAGYTDEENKLYQGDLPVIIFGDHTRVFKYVNFPFVAGADGVKVILPDKVKCHPSFLYYALLNVKIKSIGYNRHYPILREKKIPLPPLEEQQKIAKVLSTIQQAIEQQDKIIETTRKLKKSLLHTLFTEGLNGEEQKETEIGLIPKSWDVVRLGDSVIFTKKPRTLNLSEFKKIPFIPMEMIPIEELHTNGYHLKSPNEITSGVYCEKGDILLAKITPSFENGKQGIVENIPHDFAFATTEVYPLKPRNTLDKLFFFYFLIKSDVREAIAGKMQGTTGRKRVPKEAVENSLIPLPPLHEQQQIAHILSTVDKKIEIEERRKAMLKELFKTMLHKLMTGEIRLKEVKI
jgi:type I restriction enzyme S subunit